MTTANGATKSQEHTIRLIRTDQPSNRSAGDYLQDAVKSLTMQIQILRDRGSDAADLEDELMTVLRLQQQEAMDEFRKIKKH